MANAKPQVRLDEDVQQLASWAIEREAREGRPGMSEKQAINWLAREGARVLKLGTPIAKKVPR